jgi:hypothetical protein
MINNNKLMSPLFEKSSQILNNKEGEKMSSNKFIRKEGLLMITNIKDLIFSQPII